MTRITLLQKARQVSQLTSRVARRVTAGEIDLAVAFVTGEISRSQALHALKTFNWKKASQSQCLINWCSTTLRLAANAGQLHIERKK